MDIYFDKRWTNDRGGRININDIPADITLTCSHVGIEQAWMIGQRSGIYGPPIILREMRENWKVRDFETIEHVHLKKGELYLEIPWSQFHPNSQASSACTFQEARDQILGIEYMDFVR